MSTNTGAALTTEPAAPKVKKSVALSGVIAGNTAVCTVGRTGNDLHYRGYDIVELARKSTFEEVAYLLIHGDLPTESQLKDYRKKLKSLRGLPAQVKTVLEQIPAAAHPMDVLRTGCSVSRHGASRKGGPEHPGRPGHHRPPGRVVRLHAASTGGTSARTAAGSTSKRTTTPWPATSCTSCTAGSLRRSMRRRSTSP